MVSRGNLISSADGVATAFALANIEQRGVLYITPGTKVFFTKTWQ